MRWILVLLLFSSSATAADLGRRGKEKVFLAKPEDDAACAAYLRDLWREGGLSFHVYRKLPGVLPRMLSADGSALVTLTTSFDDGFHQYIERTDLLNPSAQVKFSRLPDVIADRVVVLDQLLGLSENGKRALVGLSNTSSGAITDLAVVNAETGELLGTFSAREREGYLQEAADDKRLVRFAISQSGDQIALTTEFRPNGNRGIHLFKVHGLIFLEHLHYFRDDAYPEQTEYDSIAFDGDDKVLQGWSKGPEKSGVERAHRLDNLKNDIVRSQNGERFYVGEQTQESLQKVGPLVRALPRESDQVSLHHPFQVNEHTTAVTHAGYQRILWNGKGSHFRLYTIDGKILFEGALWFQTDAPPEWTIQVQRMAVRTDGRIIAHVKYGWSGQVREAVMLSDFVVR